VIYDKCGEVLRCIKASLAKDLSPTQRACLKYRKKVWEKREKEAKEYWEYNRGRLLQEALENDISD
jgi:hypothetical protein